MTALGADGISLLPTAVCTYGPPLGDRLCGRPATLHVCPQLDDGGPAAWTITTCREHEAIARASAYELHPLASWVSATDDAEPSRCDVLPESFAAEAAEHEAVHA